MDNLNDTAMLQFINDLPAHVIGIRATGEVTKDDFDTVLLPRMDELVKRQGEINYILVLQTEVQNFTIGAWWDDLKLGLKHFTKWKKIAIVTDQAIIEKITDVFSFAIPGETRGYKLSQLDDAVAWVSSKFTEQLDVPANASGTKTGSQVNAVLANDDADDALLVKSTLQQPTADPRVDTVVPENDR
jgi:hypothetical protein